MKHLSISTVTCVLLAISFSHLSSVLAGESQQSNAVGDKINLEDIERDNILSEIRSKETLQAQPTQHVPPAHSQSIQHPSSSVSPTGAGPVSHQSVVFHHDNSGHQQQISHPQEQYNQQNIQNHQQGPQLSGGITYANQGAYSHQIEYPQVQNYQQNHLAGPQFIQPQIHSQIQAQPVVYYSHDTQYPQEQVQYIPDYSSNLIAPIQPQIYAPHVHPVHEEHRTYSAPSRHSLQINAQQQKQFKSQPNRAQIGSRPRPNLINPQPQYVYIQAGNNAASAQQQRQFQQKQQQYQQQSQQQSQQLNQPQKQQNVEVLPPSQPSPSPTPANVEYVPAAGNEVNYYNQPQQFVQYYPGQGSAPQHHVPLSSNVVLIPYAAPIYHQPPVHQQVFVPPVPAVPHGPVQEVPHYVHPTKQASSSQLLLSHANTAPSHHYPAQNYINPVQYQHQTVYPADYSHAAYSNLNYATGHNYFQPTLDFFGHYSRQHSLLDSYIPSNIIYSKSRGVYNQHFNHQSPAEVDHSQGYNTIAYSTEQKPVVVPAPIKRSSNVSTVLKPKGASPKSDATKLVKKN